MLALNWAPLVGGTVVTRKVWESLPPETRAALKKAADDAGAQIKARSRKESDEAVAAMEKRGLKVHAVTPEIEAEWRQTVEEPTRTRSAARSCQRTCMTKSSGSSRSTAPATGRSDDERTPPG